MTTSRPRGSARARLRSGNLANTYIHLGREEEARVALEHALNIDPHDAVFSDAQHPDYGCNTESYFNQKFIELETLSPTHQVQPGKSLVHVETWDVYDRLDGPLIQDEIRTLVGEIV